MTKVVSMDGVENAAVGMIKQAKKDFVKGAKILYAIFKRIPTYDELIKDELHRSLTNNQDVRWMYDSWRFVHDDPYSMFDDEQAIINQWTIDAIIAYYKQLYAPGAVIMCSVAEPKEPLYLIRDGRVRQTIEDDGIYNGFIMARNYIYTIPGGKEMLEDWDIHARDVYRKKGVAGAKPKKRKPININGSEFYQRQRALRDKNKQIAKELSDAGMSSRAIAQYLGLSHATINTFIKELASEGS